MTEDRQAVFHVRFDGLTTAAANQAAIELQEKIREVGGVQADIAKERSDTQDFGATIVLILGTKAAVEVARAIHAYIAKRGDRVVIETADGRVVATGSAAGNINVSKTVTAMRSQLDEN